MKKLSIVGTLSAAIYVLVDKESVACTQVEISDLTTGELFAARANAKDGEFWGIHELAAKTQLIAKDGSKHELSYAMLEKASSANYKVLEQLDVELTLKLKAESLYTPSS